MLFPERPEPEQDPNVQQAEEGNADTASNGGLKRQQPDLNRTGSVLLLYRQCTSRRSRMDVYGCRHKTVRAGTCQYSFAAQMITSTAQLRWRTQKYSAS